MEGAILNPISTYICTHRVKSLKALQVGLCIYKCVYIQEGILGQFFQTQCRVPIPQPCQLAVEEVDLVMCVHENHILICAI